MTELAGQHHEPDVARRARLLPVRRAKASATSTRACPTAATCAATPITTTTMRATRRPTAGASSTSAAPTLWLFDPAGDRSAARRHRRRRRIARRRRASSSPAAEHLAAFTSHPAGPQRRARRARQALHVRAVGRRGAPARRGRRRALSPRAVAAPTATTLVAVSDASGEERVEVFEDGARATLPWDIGRVIAMRAAPRGGAVAHRQPPQRSADRRSRQRRADRRSIAATPAAATTSPGRPTARGSPTRSGRARATARSSCTTSRTRHEHARHAARVPRLLRRRSIRRASTSTSCRCAPSIRSTTACSSSSASRAPRGRT